VIDQIRLERLKFCVLLKFQESELAIPPQIDFSYDSVIAGEIWMRVIVGVLGQTLTPVIIRHPKDWWEHFKDRFAPQWFLSRWPVKNRVRTVNFRLLYPTIPDVSGHKGQVNVSVIGIDETSEWREESAT